MVDKALFIGTSGAKDSMHELQLITNNLANSSTTGFRADYETSKPYQVDKNGEQTRAYAVLNQAYSDFKHGPIYNTGRDLDVAISGDGFIAVQSASGAEGYTRAGNLQIKDGFLETQTGQLILGVNGVIAIPKDADRISIGGDGSVSAQLKGSNDIVTINRMKLTNPPTSQLQKGADGLFYMSGDDAVSSLPLDEKVRLSVHALEGSNVSTVEMLTDLIDLSRKFELHTNLMKSVQDNASRANQILEVPKG